MAWSYLLILCHYGLLAVPEVSGVSVSFALSCWQFLGISLSFDKNLCFWGKRISSIPAGPQKALKAVIESKMTTQTHCWATKCEENQPGSACFTLPSNSSSQQLISWLWKALSLWICFSNGKPKYGFNLIRRSPIYTSVCSEVLRSFPRWMRPLHRILLNFVPCVLQPVLMGSKRTLRSAPLFLLHYHWGK